MARRPKYDPVALPDGRKIPFGFKRRGKVYYVRFPSPSDPAKYAVVSTERTTEGEAYQRAAEIVRGHYAPEAERPAPKATWAAVLADLRATSGLRPRSFESYDSAVGLLVGHVATAGPSDVTPEKARRFRAAYAGGTFTRSDKPGAREYPRAPKTVENALRRMSGLWNKYLVPQGYAADNPWAAVPRPAVPKKAVRVPPEEDVAAFLAWVRLRYPGWELLMCFLEVKMLAGCRTMDLCSVLSPQLDVRAGTLTIAPEQDKTHRQRVIPLPADVAGALVRIRGPKFLWERYSEDAKTHRPGSGNREGFSPRTLYWCVNNLFREWGEASPGRKITPHDLRRRAITLTVVATGGNVDATAQAIGIDPGTARRHYLDSTRAFDGQELMRKMADVLRQKE